MKNLVMGIFMAGIFVLSSCEKVDLNPVSQDEIVLKSATKVLNFRAHLSGDQEVPAVITNATGQAIFKLSKDKTELSYKLIVADIVDVRMSHIHMAPAGTNGGVVVWLYPSAFPPVLLPGKTNGILAEGVITASNLTGDLEGEPLWSLIEAMLEGDTYVNVHTVANPSGEIRGQIKGNMPGN